MSNKNLSLYFHSGLSIRRAKDQAKKALKNKEYLTLNAALDAIAEREMRLPWSKTIDFLKHQQSTANTLTFMTLDDIEVVMKANPELTYDGLGISWQVGRPINEYLPSIKNAKTQLITKRALDECNRACEYLQYVHKRKTINDKQGSYGLKHAVEHYQRARYPDKTHGEFYISNGAFLCAALFMGFNIKKKGYTSINAWINCSQKSPIFLWRELHSKKHGCTLKELEKLTELERELELPQSDTTKQYETGRKHYEQSVF